MAVLRSLPLLLLLVHAEACTRDEIEGLIWRQTRASSEDERRALATRAWSCARDARDAGLVWRVGAALANAHLWHDAALAFARHVRLAPEATPSALVALGKARAHSGDRDGSASAFSRAAALHASDPDVWYEWARAVELTTDEPLTRARANFTRAALLALGSRRRAAWTSTRRLRPRALGARARRVIVVRRREHAPTLVVGNDGVALDAATRAPLETWHGSQTRFHANVVPASARAPPREYPRAALVATPMGTGYYHFLTDGLPRAVIAARVARGAPLLVQRDGVNRRRHAFVDDFLRRAGVAASRVEPVDVVPRGRGFAATAPRALIHSLVFVDWAWSRGPADDGAPWHLPPPDAFAITRAALGLARRPLPRENGTSEQRPVVVVVLRRAAATRRLAERCERALLDALRAAPLDARVFADDDDDGRRDGPAARALRVFGRADAVVGVHGAGLANAMLCRSACALLELALPRAPHARYFEHLARSLALPYAAAEVAVDAPLGAPAYSAHTVCPREHPADVVVRLLALLGVDPT